MYFRFGQFSLVFELKFQEMEVDLFLTQNVMLICYFGNWIILKKMSGLGMKSKDAGLVISLAKDFIP